jgi:hypothetical protein
MLLTVFKEYSSIAFRSDNSVRLGLESQGLIYSTSNHESIVLEL